MPGFLTGKRQLSDLLEFEKNHSGMIALYLSARKGNRIAQKKLGYFYFQLGVNSHRSNFRKSFRWYLCAANQGDCHSQYSVGLLYYLGEGVFRNRRKAKKWFIKAADNGSRLAESMLRTNYVS